MVKNPITYEINTRTWIKHFGPGAKLDAVPLSYWKKLKEKGVDYVWLMGVWQTTPASIEAHCFHPDLVGVYDSISKNWKREDIYGSPYAVEDYIVADYLGTSEDLRKVRDTLHQLEMGLILDFIPNHFNAHSELVNTNPEVFIEVDEDQAKEDPHTYYQSGTRYFAHGKDPYFPAWTDTVQVNYMEKDAHDFMCQRLMEVAELCDGVRCDMAMLMLPDIFARTWQHAVTGDRYKGDFWKKTIAKIKKANPGFLFIAEAYWDTQWHLQQLGFDYTYDKHLLDLLKRGAIQEIENHLNAEIEYQTKCVRFIENHDEDRSLSELGEAKSRAASVIMSTIPGMKLYYDGQWEGRRKRQPVQMGTDFGEGKCVCSLYQSLAALQSKKVLCACQSQHYVALLKSVGTDFMKNCDWRRLPVPGEYHAILAWECYDQENRIVIVVNYSPENRQATIEVPDYHGGPVRDILNNLVPAPITYEEGKILLSLPGYKSTVLSIKGQN